jgi:hypothetical protein
VLVFTFETRNQASLGVAMVTGTEALFGALTATIGYCCGTAFCSDVMLTAAGEAVSVDGAFESATVRSTGMSVNGVGPGSTVTRMVPWYVPAPGGGVTEAVRVAAPVAPNGVTASQGAPITVIAYAACGPVSVSWTLRAAGAAPPAAQVKLNEDGLAFTVVPVEGTKTVTEREIAVPPSGVI